MSTERVDLEKESQALTALIERKSKSSRADLSWQWHEYRQLVIKTNGDDSVVKLLPEEITGDHHFLCETVTGLAVAGIRTVDDLAASDLAALQDEYGNPVSLSADQKEFAAHLQALAIAEKLKQTGPQI